MVKKKSLEDITDTMVSKCENPVETGNTESSLAHDLKCSNILRTEDIQVTDDIEFKNLLLPDFILRGLNAANFYRPSPIQLRSIPLLRLGLDLIVQSKAGTGKTLVITLAALETVQIQSRRLQVIVVAPTREIALQTKHFIAIISSDVKIRTEVFIGGTLVKEDKKNLLGCQIAIGTPGRLNNLIDTGDMSLSHVRLFVLDEADKLMEKPIFPQVKAISKLLPPNKQTILCSATFLHPVKEYVMKHMKEPFWVTPEESTRLQPGNLEHHKLTSTVLLGVAQFFKEVPNHPQIVRKLKYKLEEILDILSSHSFTQCIIFSNYQTRAETICHQLVANGWPAMSVRGQDEQSHRSATLNSFKNLGSRLLLTTDVMSRGVDFKGVDLVINLDIPYDSSTYLHRMGRAGRFGSYGCVITLASEGEEVENFKKILSEIHDVAVYNLPVDLTILKDTSKCHDLFFGSISMSTNDCNVSKEQSSVGADSKQEFINSGCEVSCLKETSGTNKEQALCDGDFKTSCKVKSPKSKNDILGRSMGKVDTTLLSAKGNEALPGIPTHSSKTKAPKELIQNATAEVSEALRISNHKDMKLHSFEELEMMFSNWAVNDSGKCDNGMSKGQPKPKDWWKSASIVLTAADLQLQDIKEKAVNKPEQILGGKIDALSDSSASSSINIKVRNQYLKKKNNRRRHSKSFMNCRNSSNKEAPKNKEVDDSGSTPDKDSSWLWDETSKLFYVWDIDHSCYHLYNPYVKCSFKWEPESNKYSKWDSESQTYRLWDCSNGQYLTSHVARNKVKHSSTNLLQHQMIRSPNQNLSSWFSLWNKHMQHMSWQIYQMEYLKNLSRKSRHQ